MSRQTYVRLNAVLDGRHVRCVAQRLVEHEATEQRRMVLHVMMMLMMMLAQPVLQIHGQLMVVRRHPAHRQAGRHAMMQIGRTVRRRRLFGARIVLAAIAHCGRRRRHIVGRQRVLQVGAGAVAGGGRRQTIHAGGRRMCGDRLVMDRRQHNDVGRLMVDDAVGDLLLLIVGVETDDGTGGRGVVAGGGGGGDMQERFELAKVERFVVNAADEIGMTYGGEQR